MKEVETNRFDRGGRRFSRRRWGLVALVGAGTMITASLTGIASASARPAPTQTMVGRAFNVTVATSNLGVTTPIVGPVEDTGVISTTTSETYAPPCTVLTGLVAATGLCNEVIAVANPSDVTAATNLATVLVGAPGVPAITLRGVSATSETTCAGSVGQVQIAYLAVGTHVVINTLTTIKPNTGLSVAGIKITLNQQVPNVAPAVGLRVNAAQIQIGNGVSALFVTIGHAESLIRKC